MVIKLWRPSGKTHSRIGLHLNSQNSMKRVSDHIHPCSPPQELTMTSHARVVNLGLLDGALGVRGGYERAM